jgi:hypothetical protein
MFATIHLKIFYLPVSYLKKEILMHAELKLTVVGTNPCVRRPLDVKGTVIRRVQRVGRGFKYYKHHFPPSVLCSSVSQLLCRQFLWFTWHMHLVSLHPQASDVGKTRGLVPATAHALLRE